LHDAPAGISVIGSLGRDLTEPGKAGVEQGSLLRDVAALIIEEENVLSFPW
jgi:hypothetical protein